MQRSSLRAAPLFAAMAIVLSILLGGCGQQRGFERQEASDVVPSAAPTEIQSLKERQLVVLFGTLLQMDRVANLSITGPQASGMLPIVRNSVAAGEMGAAEAKKLQALLTPEQQRFYNEASAKFEARRREYAGGGDYPPRLSDEDRKRMMDEVRERRQQRGENDPGPAEGDAEGGAAQSPVPADGSSSGPERSPPAGGSGDSVNAQQGGFARGRGLHPSPGNPGIGEMDKNIEQQLLELLESKSKT